MFSRYVCNFLDTLSYPPWRKNLNWDLHMTLEGKERIPFHSYVRPGTIVTGFPGQVSSFPQFSMLPAELQLRILTFCPVPTLFQVMRVSSTLRIEASKLFWTNPNAYFLAEANWLIDGGYPGYSCHDFSFLPYVQNVEIEYPIGVDDRICPLADEVMAIQQHLITNFWKSLKKRFPNAKKVVLDYNHEASSWRKDTEPVPQPLRILIQFCPPEIDVSAFVLEGENPLINISNTIPYTNKAQRSLYRPLAGGVWTKVESGKHYKTILMPMKRFQGPVGEAEGLKYEGERVLQQEYGRWPLMIEAVDRYHFDDGKKEPFSCPSSGCDAYFEKAGDWTVHAAKSHWVEWIMGKPSDILPNELRVVFEDRKRALQRRNEKIKRYYDNIRAAWNEEGGEKRREIERGWIEQLENDEVWDTGEKASESRLWTQFSLSLNPDWCG